MAAVIVNAVQGEIWFDGMRFGAEPIKFPHGLLSEEQLEGMRAEGSGLAVVDWVDAPERCQAPAVLEERKRASRAKPQTEAQPE